MRPSGACAARRDSLAMAAAARAPCPASAALRSEGGDAARGPACSGAQHLRAETRQC